MGELTGPHGQRAAAVARVAVVVLASLALGGATSLAQGVLPDALSSLANSASGWTLLMAVLVFWARVPAAYAAVLGAVSFVLLVLGYAAVSEMRGLYYSPVRWGLIGVVAGPILGVATAWLRGPGAGIAGVRTACGAAALAAVGIADAIHGLAVVGETTSPVYWTLIGLVGVALLAGMLILRLRGALPVAAAVLGTAAGTGVLLVGYQVIGTI